MYLKYRKERINLPNYQNIMTRSISLNISKVSILMKNKRLMNYIISQSQIQEANLPPEKERIANHFAKIVHLTFTLNIPKGDT